MLSQACRLSRQLRTSQAAKLCCNQLSSGFATGPQFTDEADQFVKAAATLKGKPGRAEQVKAFAESKEAARRIAEKMSGEAINWQQEETKARNNLKRKMMEWGTSPTSLYTRHCHAACWVCKFVMLWLMKHNHCLCNEFSASICMPVAIALC